MPREGVEPAARANWGPLAVQIPTLFRAVLLTILAEGGVGSFTKRPRGVAQFLEDALSKRKFEKPLGAKPKQS